MKTYPSLKLIAVACMGTLASCAPPPASTTLPTAAAPHPDSSLPGQLFKEVNTYRRNHGASDLERHAGLDRLAQQHCEYLRQHRGQFGLYGKNVSHFGSEGRALVARERYHMYSVSENVAATNFPGKNPAPTLVKLWSESKSHGYNMCNSWTHTGVGVVVDPDGMVFATQIFAAMSYSQLSSRDRFNRF